MKEETKCYCGHTTYCDCSPLEQPKQEETLEEAAEKYNSQFFNKEENKFAKEDFIRGAEWQQERSYSEKEVLQILSSYADWSINDVKEWLEQFKKK